LNPPPPINRYTSGLDASVQPWVPSIYMYNDTQPGTAFAHEALHLLQRLSGVDPRSIAGDVVVQFRVPGRDPAKFWGDAFGVRYRPASRWRWSERHTQSRTPYCSSSP